MYLALYRKYRPRTFEEVIGQEHIVKTLVNQIKYDKISHAYLFTGSRGIQTVIFSKNVESIDREAFYQSKDLKRVVNLTGVKFIGKNAFFTFAV